MLEVKSGKENIPQIFSKEYFVAPSSLLLWTTWTHDHPFLDLPSTSRTNYSTIPILPRPIKPGPYAMVEREKSYAIAFIF